MRFLGRTPPTREEAPAPRTSTPVYERDPTRPRPKSVVARTADDQLVDLMLDGEYWDAREVAGAVSRGEWVEALEGCLRRGYAFDRDGARLRMRRRGVAERMQTAFEVVEGITVSDLRPLPPLPPPREVVDVASSQEPEVGGDTELPNIVDVPAAAVVAGARLSLSEGDDPLTLPVSGCGTMTAAILAKRSSGKTYLAMVIVEEILSSGVGFPVVVLDPTGVWTPGLRCMADGTPSPYQVLTIGGPHGDLPLESCQGAAAAEVVERLRPHSVVIDLSDLAPAGQHEVVADFGERIYATRERSPILIVIDECDEFAPQSLSGSAHQKRSLEILDRIVRRGRIKGFGTILVSQRAAVVNKNMLSQIDTLFLLCMIAPSDLDAVEDWLRHVVPVGQRSQCLGQLPGLQPGSAFYMRGGAEPSFRKFGVRRRATYDASRTPDVGDERRGLSLSQVDPEVLAIARGIMESAAVPGGSP